MNGAGDPGSTGDSTADLFGLTGLGPGESRAVALVLPVPDDATTGGSVDIRSEGRGGGGDDTDGANSEGNGDASTAGGPG